MPIIAELNFEDGTKEVHKFPVQIWRRNQKSLKHIIVLTLWSSTNVSFSGVELMDIMNFVIKKGSSRVVEQSFHKVNGLLFAAGVATMVFSVLLQSFRWRYILKQLADFSVVDTFESTTISHWVNFVLPFKSGELMRPYYLAKKRNQSFEIILSSALLERIFDVMAIGVLATIAIGVLVTQIQFILVIAFLFLGIGLVFVFISEEFGRTMFRYAAVIIPAKFLQGEMRKSLVSLYEGVKLLTGVERKSMVTIYTFAIWMANIASNWLIISSCDLPFELKSLLSGTLVTSACAVSHTIPSTAAGLGVVNYSVFVVVEKYASLILLDSKVFSSKIFVASSVVYLANVIPDVFIGGYFFLKNYRIIGGFNNPKIL